MSPIDKISDIRRLPLLGTIRLGIKKEGKGTSYPQAVDYFVCPVEVQAVYGEQPKELKIMLPADDLEEVAPQYYKCYSYSQGLICKGTGTESMRKVDTFTGDFANRDTKQWVLTEGGCDPSSCPMIATKQCRRMMSLFFILYEVPGLGVYRLNTSSWHSIVNINSQLAKSPDPEHVPDGFLRQFTRGRIAFIPLVLFLKEQPVTPMGEGRKTVHVLNVRADVKLADIIRISRQRPAQVLLPTIGEEEPPEDLYPEEVLAEAEVIHEGEVPPEPAGGGEAPLKGGDVDASITSAEPAATVKEGEAGKAGEAAPSPTKAQKQKPRAARPARPAVPDFVGDKAAVTQSAEEPFGEPEAGVAGPAEPGDEGFSIDLEWLSETLRHIRWTEDTAKSWIASKWPDVDKTGKLVDVISRLTRERAEVFFNEIRERTEKRQPGLFD